MALLEDTDYHVREGALQNLMIYKMGPKVCAEHAAVLVARLRDGDWHVRRARARRWRP